MSLANLLDEIDQLPQSDKWQLVLHLLDSLQQEKAHTPPETWQDFVDRCKAR